MSYFYHFLKKYNLATFFLVLYNLAIICLPAEDIVTERNRMYAILIMNICTLALYTLTLVTDYLNSRVFFNRVYMDKSGLLRLIMNRTRESKWPQNYQIAKNVVREVRNIVGEHFYIFIASGYKNQELMRYYWIELYDDEDYTLSNPVILDPQTADILPKTSKKFYHYYRTQLIDPLVGNDICKLDMKKQCEITKIKILEENLGIK